ncbi:DUF6268 family outer membrane beta-barrel protein [Patiriisocius marinus]|uniref:DUF6268 domain-containing protein n=1 Tax=Patiriisocius marinus TaxID=1397112 RepID=A0A5J4IXQ2_9FLAO|nr:DUF6268 family outer membrane beta-barrel protein [Patiriisocius marinus]GER59744.1 hypothetical protein ULMA_18520 [Patiriisocius marinus]
MIYKSLVFILVSFLFVQNSNAQLTDLARLEYTYFPQDNSDNTFKRLRAFVNYPYEIYEDAYLVVGVEYRNVNLLLRDNLPFDNNNIERFQSFTGSLGFTDKMENNWRWAVQAEIKLASNFDNSITGDDYIFGGSAYFIKDRTKLTQENMPKKPWRLIMGLNYSTTAGRPFPLPFINYYREFAPKWSHTLGVPKSNVKYKFVPGMAFQAFITLDGFYANIQENTPISLPDNSQLLGENISLTTLLSGLGYEWEFMDHFVFYVYGGHTIINEIRFRDSAGDNVYVINDENNWYGRSGIKVKI